MSRNYLTQHAPKNTALFLVWNPASIIWNPPPTHTYCSNIGAGGLHSTVFVTFWNDSLTIMATLHSEFPGVQGYKSGQGLNISLFFILHTTCLVYFRMNSAGVNNKMNDCLTPCSCLQVQGPGIVYTGASAHLNRIEPLMLLVTPVLFLLWQVRMS